MTTLEKIKSIFKLIEQSDVTELFWEKDDLRVDLRRSTEPMASKLPPPEAETLSDENSSKSTGPVIAAQMVGTFYATHPQSKQVFAQKGLKVNTGQVVGVIEAMNVYREIFSSVDGIISDILVADGQPVMYAQELIQLQET